MAEIEPGILGWQPGKRGETPSRVGKTGDSQQTMPQSHQSGFTPRLRTDGALGLVLFSVVPMGKITVWSDQMRPAEQVEVVRLAKDGSVRLGDVA